ncbi:PQQ-binding-like beta-propeller repeat protein [Flavobacterium sp. GT3P67]|uniref:outer membrane protein assembly factor BamB family protein n=1 Tax=Flavobacterium sp. GT3P67 TaxID=2541722 RepID=UPI0010540C8A|nr:PQQ-binding-like beta-propeller repeat protein [Flavobacterium sp. GT3P67]TDE53076.1 hypothetical protein E0H99_10385 [Flavobacterium sp. GT3P67]
MYNQKNITQTVSRLVFCVGLLLGNIAVAQTEFFNSKIPFSENQLSNFYSSISIDSSQVYLNANDYKIYAYDKKTGALNWSYYVANKSNNAPKLYQDNVFIEKHISEYVDKCIQLNVKTGDTIQTLSIVSINTQPIFKGNIMYCTAIDTETGGIVLAYDLKKNAVIWKKFIAHGVDKQPYYLKDKIIANAEENNWFELNYSGKLLDTKCKHKATLFAEDIKCIRNFRYLIHNQKELSVSYFDIDEVLKLKYTKDKTIVLGENKMLIINNKNKIENEVKLEEIVPFTENRVSNYTEILKAEANTVWLIYLDTLVIYDLKKNKTVKTFDLIQWNVHQAILEDNNLWLISRNDGQLVKLELDNRY